MVTVSHIAAKNSGKKTAKSCLIRSSNWSCVQLRSGRFEALTENCLEEQPGDCDGGTLIMIPSILLPRRQRTAIFGEAFLQPDKKHRLLADRVAPAAASRRGKRYGGFVRLPHLPLDSRAHIQMIGETFEAGFEMIPQRHRGFLPFAHVIPVVARFAALKNALRRLDTISPCAPPVPR